MSRTTQVIQRRRKPAERPQRHTAPVQDPPSQDTASQMNGTVEGGEPVRRPADEDQRNSESSQHIGFAIWRASPAGQA
jgi:hypothetical protein